MNNSFGPSAGGQALTSLAPVPLAGAGLAESGDRPPYSITSVDNALILLDILRTEGSVRVSDAAARIGVARSTAHRLLAMLCYRGFAVRNDDHEYLSGWAMPPRSPHFDEPQQTRLRALMRPYLLELRQQVDETVHLMELGTAEVRFIDSVESSRSVRVGSRMGQVMPAHLTSGGQALLAELSMVELSRHYPDGPPAGAPGAPQGLDRWFRALGNVRHRRYGINDGLSERGLTAIGATVHARDGRAVAALCVSAPRMRLGRPRIPATAESLLKVVDQVESAGLL